MHAKEEVLSAVNQLYREGWLVKALDASGQPLLCSGQQVYKTREYTTVAELAFWCRENGSN
jgi:hypothetical protein